MVKGLAVHGAKLLWAQAAVEAPNACITRLCTLHVPLSSSALAWDAKGVKGELLLGDATRKSDDFADPRAPEPMTFQRLLSASRLKMAVPRRIDPGSILQHHRIARRTPQRLASAHSGAHTMHLPPALVAPRPPGEVHVASTVSQLLKK